MTRIIAGFAGSLSLAVPRAGTRPTSDRVREAIFSALDARGAVEGMHVLDLYAGSGALGLEAASRGAAHVTLVDQMIATAQANAARILTRAPAGLEIVTTGQRVQAFLDATGGSWQLVFLDPPYELADAELTLALQALVPRLADDAVVVLERGARTPAPTLPAGLELERRKDYGDTALYWLAPTA